MKATFEQLENWGQLSTGDGIDREAFGAVIINEAIRASDMLAQKFASDPRDDVREHYQKRASEYQNYSKLLSYLRDRFEVGSIAEALDAIAARRIELAIIKVWAFELFPDKLPPNPIGQAIINAYPEVATAMNERGSKYISEVLDAAYRKIDEM